MTGHRWQFWGGVTYAQHGEDLIFLNLFSRMGITHPSYLDIGANHPRDISNTALLYERGCRGINVEPNPAMMAAFERDRPRDINLCCGVGPVSGERRLYIGSEPGRSSFIHDEVPQIARQKLVPIQTADEIVQGHWSGQYPDLLSVDAEGMDYDILASINFSIDMPPKIICVEVWGNRSISGIPRLLEGRNYRLLMWAGQNMIWVNRKYDSVLA